MAIFGTGMWISLLLVFALFVEYLVRSWIETRPNGLAAYQFALSGMLIMTAAFAIVLGLFQVVGAVMVAILLAALIIFACWLEAVCRSRSILPDEDPPEDQLEHEPMTTDDEDDGPQEGNAPGQAAGI